MVLKTTIIRSLFFITLCSQGQTNGVFLKPDTIDWLPARKDVHAGSILVPENHKEPRGNKIQMTYIVIKAKDTTTTKYPQLIFSGGPGVNSLDPGFVNYLLEVPIRDDRDIILFDQRGVGYSSALPDMSLEAFEILAKNANDKKELELMRALIDKYQKICRVRGINPQFYNTIQSARDIGMLFEHLPYKKYNLMGVSYGARLARVVQDLYPDFIHTSVLDSPAPLSGDFLLNRLESYALALQKIFDYCVSNPQCQEEYPRLKDDYLRAISLLEEKPLELYFTDTLKVYINSQDGIYLLRKLLYQNNAREKTPELIKAYIQGGGKVIKDVLQTEYKLKGELNLTMLLSVEKYENFNPANTARIIEEQYEKYPLIPVRLGFFDAFYKAGMTWHPASLPLEERKFQHSNIPTLIFVNQFDPVTPPKNGYLFKETLSRGTLLILDEGGHGGGNWECKDRLILDFMNNPEMELNTSCLK